MTESKDGLGDRMKGYETAAGAEQRLLSGLPVVVRLDGKAFHTFTRGLNRPYDQRLSELMTSTMGKLVDLTNARIGYTQSDEITLILQAAGLTSEIYFSGRVFKMLSVLAAECSVLFNRAMPLYLPEKATDRPVFDCRVFNVPTRAEAVNALIWRQQDATRNAISMAAQSEFSPKQLHGISCNQMQEMLFQKRKINFNDYPVFFKRGTFVQRRTVVRAFTTAELDKLPFKHAARDNPDLQIERHEFKVVELPQLTKIVNREDVVFDGADPLTA